MNKKLFCFSIKYEDESTGELIVKKEYVHGSNSAQAATALGERLGRFIDPTFLKEVKPLRKYLCWYVSDTKVQYFYMIAKSNAQAWYYYCNQGFIKMRDHMCKDSVLALTGIVLPFNTELKEGQHLPAIW